MNVRTIAASLAALAIPLTACSSGSQGTAERSAPASSVRPKASTTVDCSADSDLSQADWLELCGDKAGDEKAPDTSLKVGDTFRYKDGVRVTVTGLPRVTRFGEFDDRPEAGKSVFWVNITFRNDSKKPIKLDDWALEVQGATNGGEAEGFYIEQGAQDITGRVAPGITTHKNSAYSLDKQYGTQVVVTVTRMDEETDVLAKDPEWTGTIR